MKNEKKRRSVTAALMWRITALALALWLCMMCGITWMCAKDVSQQYAYGFYAYGESLERDLQKYEDPVYHYEKEDIQYSIMNRHIYMYTPLGDSLDYVDIYDYAILCFDKMDEEGNWVAPCWVEDGNYMTFYYDAHDAVDAEKYGDYAYIDLDETQFGRDIVAESKRQYLSYAYGYERGDDGYRFERLTGWFEGNQFHLVEVADYPDGYAGYTNWHFWQDNPVPEEEWITVVDTAEPGQKLVHIYPQFVNIRCGSTQPVKVDGVTYDNLGDMLENDVYYGENSIFKTVYQSHCYFTDASGGEYCIVMAVQFSPLKIAFISLLVFYAVTLLILAVILLLIYRGIRKKLVRPMHFMLKLVTEDSKYMPEPEESWWGEVHELCTRPLNAIHEYKKEITQLNTALDYARDAEENRRALVSNITHELKTPLAVIHSYAEGLKEGIAADKQEHYLNVILDEAQRMDGMVLEMLDLSRLEAGKVRLATDRFSLLELTKRVVDKMKLLVEEKELSIEYVQANDCEITADESRIAQAVTNLVSNAIKYSPRGSTLKIGVTRVKEKAMFSIENESEPLSEEVLAKIWDSFYRADASWTEKGTGLGLSITKAIIELHGGTCHVSNTITRRENDTFTGVEFKFYLP